MKEISRRLIGGVWETGVADEGGSGNGNAVQPLQLDTILTAADLYDLDNTPIEIVPAAGADMLVLPKTILYLYEPGAIPFNTDMQISWQWGDDSFGSGVDTPVTVAITAGASMTLHTPSDDVDNHRGDPADLIDQPILASSPAPPVVTGSIASASVNDAGVNYAPGDTGTFGGGTGGTYTITTVDGGGGVTGFTVTNTGSAGYYVGLLSELIPGGGQPGSGINSRAIINSISDGVPGDGMVKVTVVYQILDIT